MGYDSVGLRRAADRLSRQKTDWTGTRERLRRALFQEAPELSEIDRELRKTMVETAARCLRTGEDPRPALQKIRDRNLALQARQAEILAGLGRAPDALAPVPMCRLCGDAGWRDRQMCSCLRSLYVEEELKLLRESVDIDTQTFDTFSLNWYSPVPQEGENRSPLKKMEAVRDVCRKYAVEFGRFSTRNLFFTGEPGLGKTFLSACIARTVAEQGFWVMYASAAGLFSAFREQNYSNGEADGRQARRYLNCDLLILDDLGSEWTIPSAQAALYTVVNDRLKAQKHTVISSNLDMDGLSKAYSRQTVSRIQGEYRKLKFVGEDIRTQRKDSACLEQHAVSFKPINPMKPVNPTRPQHGKYIGGTLKYEAQADWDAPCNRRTGPFHGPGSNPGGDFSGH